MARDGFVEPKGNKRLGINQIIILLFSLLFSVTFYNFCISGKRVIHSELTEKKFIEVQKVLSAAEAMVITAEHEVYNYINIYYYDCWPIARFKILQDVVPCEPNSKSKQTGHPINGKDC